MNRRKPLQARPGKSGPTASRYSCHLGLVCLVPFGTGLEVDDQYLVRRRPAGGRGAGTPAVPRSVHHFLFPVGFTTAAEEAKTSSRHRKSATVSVSLAGQPASRPAPAPGRPAGRATATSPRRERRSWMRSPRSRSGGRAASFGVGLLKTRYLDCQERVSIFLEGWRRADVPRPSSPFFFPVCRGDKGRRAVLNQSSSGWRPTASLARTIFLARPSAPGHAGAPRFRADRERTAPPWPG